MISELDLDYEFKKIYRVLIAVFLMTESRKKY